MTQLIIISEIIMIVAYGDSLSSSRSTHFLQTKIYLHTFQYIRIRMYRDIRKKYYSLWILRKNSIFWPDFYADIYILFVELPCHGPILKSRCDVSGPFLQLLLISWNSLHVYEASPVYYSQSKGELLCLHYRRKVMP